MIVHYCGFEAGVWNLKKCLDWVFRKVVAKLEEKNLEEQEKTWKAALEQILIARDIKDATQTQEESKIDVTEKANLGEENLSTD